MAASKPTYLQKKKNHPYTLKKQWGTSADDLGCFPFDIEPSRPKSDLLFLKFKTNKICIRSFTGFESAYKANSLGQ